jgi:nitrogen-specific signal transduction histidine kinase
MIVSDLSFGGARLDWSGLMASHEAIVKRASKLLESIPTPVFLINKYRQFVYANSAYLGRYSIGDALSILGARVGELATCPQSTTSLSGCGTSAACQMCDFSVSVVKAFNEETVGNNIQISGSISSGPGGWNISPIDFCDERYVACISVE